MAPPTLTDVPMDAVVSGVGAIASALRDAGTPVDFIVGLGRGGLVPATFLSHATGRPLLSVDLSAGLADFAAPPLERLARMSAQGRSLLFVDDINDSGRTIAHVRRALTAAGGDLARVHVAVLIDNLASAERVDHAARAIDRRVTKDWFVFPWEAMAPRDAVATDAQAVPERTR